MPGSIHKRRGSGWMVSFLMLSLLTWNGCILVPVPVDYHTRDSRGNLRVEDLKWLQPSATTREEVLLRWGEPDLVYNEDSRLTYSWKKVDVQLYVAGYGGASRTDYGPTCVLELTFDQQGRLLDSRLQESKGNIQGEW